MEGGGGVSVGSGVGVEAGGSIANFLCCLGEIRIMSSLFTYLYTFLHNI